MKRRGISIARIYIVHIRVIKNLDRLECEQLQKCGIVNGVQCKLCENEPRGK